MKDPTIDRLEMTELEIWKTGDRENYGPARVKWQKYMTDKFHFSNSDELCAAIFSCFGTRYLTSLPPSVWLSCRDSSLSSPSPLLHLLPMVHLRLMVLSSDCANYACPAAAMLYAQQFHKKHKGGGGSKARLPFISFLMLAGGSWLRSCSRTQMMMICHIGGKIWIHVRK